MGHDITTLLGQARHGDRAAVDRLFSLVYDDLKRIAQASQRDWQHSPTVNATSIVNDLCLKWLSNDLPQLDAANRRTFFATVARAIQGLLIDHVRRKETQRRGGHLQRVPLGDDLSDDARSPSRIIEVKLNHEALADALEKLRAEAPRQAEVVMLRFYAGQNYEQIAGLLEVNEKTARRDWQAARAFLNRELSRTTGISDEPR